MSGCSLSLVPPFGPSSSSKVATFTLFRPQAVAFSDSVLMAVGKELRAAGVMVTAQRGQGTAECSTWSTRWVPIYTGGNGGPEQLSKFSVVTQLVSGRARSLIHLPASLHMPGYAFQPLCSPSSVCVGCGWLAALFDGPGLQAAALHPHLPLKASSPFLPPGCLWP
jgi:hypothetical protein